jgi:hypothetical protein
VLGVGADTYDDAVDHLCGCTPVAERFGGGKKAVCVTTIDGIFADAGDVTQQSWIEAVDGGCGSCAAADECLGRPPFCSVLLCGEGMPPCCPSAGPCTDAGTCGE